MEDAEHRPGNPHTELEGYKVLDASGAEVGRVGGTVYDAVADVLKYVVVDGRAVLADRVDVDPDGESVSVPYDGQAVRSAPEIQDPSGAFDDAVREHYEGRA